MFIECQYPHKTGGTSSLGTILPVKHAIFSTHKLSPRRGPNFGGATHYVEDIQLCNLLRHGMYDDSVFRFSCLAQVVVRLEAQPAIGLAPPHLLQTE